MPKYFQTIFSITNTMIEVILRMLFLKLNNTDMLFGKEIFLQKLYITNKIFISIINQVQIIDIKTFVIAILNMDSKSFVMHMVI